VQETRNNHQASERFDDIEEAEAASEEAERAAQRSIDRDDECAGMTESEEPREESLSVPALC
jgi:hypothetical protein